MLDRPARDRSAVDVPDHELDVFVQREHHVTVALGFGQFALLLGNERMYGRIVRVPRLNPHRVHSPPAHRLRTGGGGPCGRRAAGPRRAARRRPLCTRQAVVRAALPGGELRPGVDRRLPVELERADAHQAAGLGARLGQRVLHARGGPAGRRGSRPPPRCRSWSGAPSAPACCAVHHERAVGVWGSMVKPVSSTACGRSTIRVGSRAGCEARCSATIAGEREGELPQSLVAHRADLEHRPAPRGQVGPDDLGEVAGLGHVHLVEHDHPRPVLEPAVRGQLGLDRVDVRDRVTLGLQRGAVDHVGEHGAALDVAQELAAPGPCRWRHPGSGRARRR